MTFWVTEFLFRGPSRRMPTHTSAMPGHHRTAVNVLLREN